LFTEANYRFLAKLNYLTSPVCHIIDGALITASPAKPHSMRLKLQQQQLGYLVAVGSNLALIAIAIAFGERITESMLILLAFLATALAAHCGGVRAGLASTAMTASLAVLGSHYWQGWSATQRTEPALVLSLFLLSGSLLSWLSETSPAHRRRKRVDLAKLVDMTDVTQRRLTELDLDDSSQCLASLFDNSPLTIIEWDSDFNVIRWSGQANTTFGWTATETVGQNHELLCVAENLSGKGATPLRRDQDTNEIDSPLKGQPPLGIGSQSDHPKCFQSVVDRLKTSTGNFLVFHEVSFSKSGKPVSCEWFNSVVRNNDGQMIAILSLVLDITESAQADAELRESEKRYRAFMDNNPSPAFLKNESGRYVFVNRALELAYKRPAVDWIGKSDSELPSVTDIAQLSTNDHLVLEQLKAIETEETLDNGDGQRHYLTFKFPVQADDGRVMVGGLSLDITERKRAEMHAEAQRERVQLVADAVPALISFIDTDARYQLTNRAYERWFGIPQSEMLGKSMQEVLGAAAWKAILPYVDEVLNGRPVSYEAQVPYREGGTRWVNATYTPDRSKDGTVRGFIAHVNDITARKRAEDELIYQRSLLQAITDNAQTSIFLIDVNGNALFVNPASEEMTGFSRQELVGRNLNNLFHPMPDDEPIPTDRKSYFDCTLNQLQAARNRESLFVHRSGAIYPVRWNARAVCRDGQTVATVAEVWDITKEKKAEQDLQATRDQLEAIIETAPSLIVVTDSSGRVLMFNKACETLTGFTRQESYQQKLFDLLVPEEGQEELKKRYRGAEASTLAEPHESPWITKDGNRRFIEWRCTRVPSGSDLSGTLLLGIGVDTTDRRRLEDELRNQAERLAESDRRKDEFLATLAHELRNPLAPIRLGLELLKMASDDPQTIETTRLMMERQTLQLITLVDDLLDVSRITRGKLELRKSVVALADVIQSAVEAVRPGIDEAGHTLTVEMPDNMIHLNADPNRLAQILSNLLNNSVKYTPPGGSIKLSCQCEGTQIVLAVKDNGVGVPAEMQTAIFDMFAQIDRSIERGYAGLGIGLTLVKSLVEMHEGKIEVHSDGINCGSEFKVQLPMLMEQPALVTSNDTAAAHVSNTRCRVLIVDDNKAAADMLAMLVRMQGHEVVTVSDGYEAVQQAAEFLPHMILMDIGMPKMNGYEAARAIRKQPWGKLLLLVALTGWGQDEDKRRTKAAGFDHHLVKPADPGEVRRLIGIAESRITASETT